MRRKSLAIVGGLILAFTSARVSSHADEPKAAAKRQDGDDGLTAAFGDKIKEIGEITADECARRFDPKLKYAA